MTEIQEKIIGIFKALKTPKDGVQKPQSFEIKIRDWDRRSQDEAGKAIESLIKENYISIKEGWYQLTEKGYDYIYRDYSIEDTEKIILDVIKRHKVGVGNIVISNWFISTQRSIDRFHSDNFNLAFENIINNGYLENTQQGLKLTASGYDKIY